MGPTDADALDRADMERLAAGEDGALNALMDRHGERIFHFLYRMLGNEADANDLAQEAFVRVYQHRDRFRPGEKFSTWLYTIAGNLGRNQIRWRSRHPAVSLDSPRAGSDQSWQEALPAPNPTPGQDLEAAERADAVQAAVAALPEPLREAVILCEWEDLAVAEAASVLKTTPKAVESRLYRARQILREQLGKWL